MKSNSILRVAALLTGLVLIGLLPSCKSGQSEFDLDAWMHSRTNAVTAARTEQDPSARFVDSVGTWKPAEQTEHRNGMTSPSPAPGKRFMLRPHLRIKDEQAGKQLVGLFSQKQRSTQDMQVSARMLREKRAELAKFNEELREAFKVEPDKTYRFDPENRTLYQVARRTRADGTTQAAGERFHSRFKDETRIARFQRLIKLRQLTREQIASLSLLVKEKQIEIARVDEALSKGYSVSRDRRYRYNPEKRILYEIIPVPKSGMP